MIWNRKLPPLSPFVSTAAVGFLLDFWNAIELERFTIGALPVIDFQVLGHAVNFNAVALDVVALLACSYASALIIMSGIGIRIMDLVAITMIEKWGWSFFRAKMTLEVALFTSGWLLGGPMGITTVLFLLFVGPFIQPFMWVNSRYLSIPNHGIKARAEYDARLIPHRSTSPDATDVRGSLLRSTPARRRTGVAASYSRREIAPRSSHRSPPTRRLPESGTRPVNPTGGVVRHRTDVRTLIRRPSYRR